MSMSGVEADCEEVLDSIGAGVLVLDTGLRLVRASANCRTLLGITLKEGADFTQLTGKLAALAPLIPAFRKAIAEGTRSNTEVEIDRHRYLAVGLLPSPAGSATPDRLLVTLRDITRETATEAKLVALVESTPDPFIIVEATGRIQRVNRQAEILFGYSRDELIGQSFKILVPERFRMQHEHYTRNFQLKPVMRQMGSGLELSCLTRSGEEIPVEIGLSPVVAQDETTIMVRFHDIREQKREQALLRQALQKADEANRTKSRFLAAASHDLRQPLQSISMNLGVLAGRISVAERKRAISQTRMALDTTNKLLNSLLNITKLESGKVQPEIEAFYLRDTLERVYNTEIAQARDKGQDFSLRTCGLAVNSDPGGRLVLGCRRLPGRVRIEVIDNGPGIAPDALGKIFDEYWQQEQTRLYRGTGLGLGLSIVKLLAELLHLKLSVTSTVGKGARFSVEVPIASAVPAVRLAPAEATARKTRAAGTVLLVDDDEAVLESTSLFLEMSGYRVVVASNAPLALALAETEKPDLVITDYGLAQRDTGFDLLRNIRSRLRRNLPAIVITGDTSLQRTQELGTDVEIVCKPLDPQLLLELVRKHF
jgi:PAS domain S-box-containing protein